MKKLLIFSRRFYPDVYSGTETVIYNLYHQLYPYFDVRLVCGWYNSPSLLPQGTKSIRLSGIPKEIAYWKLASFAKKEIHAIRPHVVLANSIEVPRSKGIGMALIFYDVNFGATHRSLKELLKEYYYYQKCKTMDRIIAISHASKERLIRMGIQNEKISVIHSGIDVEQFQAPDVSTAQEAFILCYPSRIVPGKGQHIAIRALKRLPTEVLEKCRLWIVGRSQDPEYLRRLKEEAVRLPVDFFTDVRDIIPYYQKADIIVYPTLLEEGFGYTAIEGMACGKPVIYSNDKAVIEATGGHGFSFNKGDIDELCKAILRLYYNRSLIVEQGKKAREWVMSMYSWENTALQYKRVLEEMIR